MRTEQAKVGDFMRKAGQETPDRPMIPADKVPGLRVRLIREECLELANAFIEKDIVEVADAIGDLLVVVLGTAVACGLDIQPIFDEIHRSNMTKFIDGHRREDGKWVKGPSYEPANLAPIVQAQSEPQRFEGRCPQCLLNLDNCSCNPL